MGATYDPQLCSEALATLTHDPINLSDAHHEQLEIFGHGEAAREAQRQAILARVPAVVTKSVEPSEPPAKPRAPRIPPRDAAGEAAVIVGTIQKATDPLRARIGKLETADARREAEHAALRTEIAALKDLVVELRADIATAREADRVRR